MQLILLYKLCLCQLEIRIPEKQFEKIQNKNITFKFMIIYRNNLTNN